MMNVVETESKEKDKLDKVHVTAVYTATGKDKTFEATSSDLLNIVIDLAYDKLKEDRRPGDKYFCSEEPRHDLAPHVTQTLGEMHQNGVCVKEKNRNKLEFEFDIDSDIGGAAR